MFLMTVSIKQKCIIIIRPFHISVFDIIGWLIIHYYTLMSQGAEGKLNCFVLMDFDEISMRTL